MKQDVQRQKMQERQNVPAAVAKVRRRGVAGAWAGRGLVRGGWGRCVSAGTARLFIWLEVEGWVLL